MEMELEIAKIAASASLYFAGAFIPWHVCACSGRWYWCIGW